MLNRYPRDFQATDVFCTRSSSTDVAIAARKKRASSNEIKIGKLPSNGL